MATYCLEDPVSPDLSCPICFEDYDILSRQRAPKLLLCLHTFCYGCAQRLWRADGTLECSLCRAVHSEVTLADLFDNLVILQHLR
ncbi:putative E3 ubiquitin-protein ligase SH3RF2 [Portunus trituberculatus]|uniref:Putative E3 ubiquitin-protein ligase SH3RF2 n=3 Tax=Portunus trituberculatus TaxID=210409 RepID=A0A5B7JN02_PORTR|nr:putative E3 ubiquitin-protein ligase SH3RF2 [Portunus trituberculatus]